MTVGATVQVEEHPELDNPLGRAQGAVQACETYLAEAREQVDRLAGKVARAEADLETARRQHELAAEEVPARELDLEAAQAALAAIKGTE